MPVPHLEPARSVPETFDGLPQDVQQRRMLNLGCGHFPKDGFLNVDHSSAYPVDFLYDLDKLPWPFPDEHYDLVEMDHVLEHLTDVSGILGELERILRPGGGCLIIRVPQFSRGFTHWDHKHGFDFSFLIYFDPKTSGGFEGSHLIPEETRLVWFAQQHLKRQHLGRFPYFIGSTRGKIFDFFGNLNLFLTSRILCYWVGEYDEICFTLRKPSTRALGG